MAVLVAASVPLVWTIRFSARPEAALPRHSKEAQEFAQLSERLARHEVLLFVARGDAAALGDLANQLQARPEFRSVLTRLDKLDAQRLLSEMLALWPTEREAELEQHFSLAGRRCAADP